MYANAGTPVFIVITGFAQISLRSSCHSDISLRVVHHAMKMQLGRLRRLFPDRWNGAVPDSDLPLFPTIEGEVVTKDAMTATIVEAGKKLGVATSTPDGSSKLTGHSLRVTGAQSLARAGLEVWASQLLGRWGSQSVLGYVREVPLELSST